MDIQAAVFRDYSGTPVIETVELTGPAADEVLVKIVATGVCHTDLKIATSEGRSPRPVVLGHEGAGVVEAVGSGIHDLQKGDHVVLSFGSCGHCPSCLTAEPALCYTADHFSCTRDDGSFYLRNASGPIHGDFFNQSSFATHAISKRRGVVKVRDDVPLEILGPLGCGIQTGAGTILNIFKTQPGQSLAVFGAGALGLSAIMAARLSGATTIIAVDVHKSRLDLAEELGATHTIFADGQPLSDKIRSITKFGVDFAFDTSTSSSAMLDAISCLAPRGTFGYAAPPSDTDGMLSLPMMPLMLGKKIVGVLEGNSNPEIFIPELIEYYKKSAFAFDKLITFYPFEEISKAFHDSEEGKCIKPILKMS
jgi:aryl-alcohol dehydrogenase